MSRRLGVTIGLLSLTASVGSGVLVWAAQKSWDIGNHADLTGGNGGTDQILWLWLFLSAGCAAASILALAILLTRVHARRAGIAARESDVPYPDPSAGIAAFSEGPAGHGARPVSYPTLDSTDI